MWDCHCSCLFPPLPFCVLFSCVHACSVAKSYPTICDPVDCCVPGSSVHGIIPARKLEWVAISSSRDLPNPEIKPWSPVSHALVGRFFTPEPPGKSSLFLDLLLFRCWISWLDPFPFLFSTSLPFYLTF